MALDKSLELLLKSLENAGVKTQDFRNRLLQAEKTGEDMVSIIREMNRALENVDGTATNLYSRLQGITKELNDSNVTLRRATSAYNQISNTAEKLRNDEQGIVDLNKYQLKAMYEKAKGDAKNLSDSAKRLAKEKGLLNATEEEIRKNDDLTDKQKEILLSRLDNHKAAHDTVALTKARLDLENDISAAVGVTGALITGTGALMERLGMRSGIFHDAMQEASEEMRHQAKLLGENVTFIDKAKIAFTGLKIVAQGFSAALYDPAVIGGKIVDSFLDLNKIQVETNRLVGRNNNLVKAQLKDSATLKDVYESIQDITEKTGLAAGNVFNTEQLSQIASAKKELGLTGDQASNLAMMTKVTNTNLSDFEDGILSGIKATNKLSKSAVAPGLALRDALDTSEDISLSLGNNPKLLGQAATAARALGLELSKVDNIAEGLLDFESSIQNELEAQLLTGKNINLAKARELALNNDLAGLSEELAKNGASAAEFANMNRIQQNALAQALGMSRQELAKSIMTQKTAASLTDEQRARVLGVNKEQLRNLDIQTQINDAITKLTETISGPLNIISGMLDSSIVRFTTMGLIVANIGAGLVKNVQMLARMVGLTKAVNKEKKIGLVTSIKEFFTQKGTTKGKQLELFTEQATNVAQKKGLFLQMKSFLLARKEAVASAIGALFKNPIAAGLALVAAAGVGALVGRLTKGDDIMSPGYGSRVLSTPEGSIALNNKDTVVAGTNLGGGGMNTKALEAKIDELIAAVKSGGDVFMDGNKVGEALTLGAYKSA